MRRFVTLSALTAVEVMRQPVCLLLTVSCIVLTAVTPLVLLYQFSEDGKIARDSGLAYHFMFGMLLVGYAACTALSREIHNGTASLCLSKPISRPVYFGAKFVGLLVAVAAFSMCASVSTLIAERASEHRAYGLGHSHAPRIDWWAGNLLLASPFVAMFLAGVLNYRRRCSFQASAYGLVMVLLLGVFFGCGFFDRFGQASAYDLRVDWRILPASLLVSAALCIFAALALSVSTRLQTTPTLVICMITLLAGLMLDYISTTMSSAAGGVAILFGVIPNWQHFWMADALLRDGVIAWSYVGSAFAYAAIYSVAVLALGMFSFLRVDLK